MDIGQLDFNIPDDKLRTLCEHEKTAVKNLGTPCARKLRARLADLMAADNVRALVAGHPHPLKGNRHGQFALDLHGGVRLVFKSANNPIPCHDDGGINWSLVTKVSIVYIGDYHD
ncbi:MAG TPA: killer suppression protein HigA [Chromatiales bacterium]|nr:killer suppression protein HigA [Thiotrichales bacterium]HIP68428.1 killer suppression protein HigA [Chromatiales bacterium]